MSLSIADKIFLCGGLIGFGGVFVYLGVALYIAYTKMDMMLAHFKNSPFIMIRAPMKDGGPWGRLFVLGGIVSVIQTPGLYIPDGGACPEDIDKFPKKLKARLITLHRVGCYFTLELLLLFVVFCIDWSSMRPARLSLALVTIAAVPVWAGLCLRLASTQTNAIVKYLNNSSAIKTRIKLNTGGRFGELCFIVAISVIVTFGTFFVRRGTVVATELITLPINIKVKLLFLVVTGVVLIVNLILLYFLGS